ncbi:alpha-amylase family glycosyl hydrolase [Polaribacter tangerinus]|uniref:alpha-amylase family glycosyl hydrolase n=1 Tax=Polaribacter tangerinus TaxID=1920034 RepID=UPI000B4C0F66|nr:alpha-amylase family glycosyl hydrolase [Polaribacter tangerinus]
MPLKENQILNGVMLNAYPDSIGKNLGDAIKMLQNEAFKNTFSFFYILPTFFNSDLDRGFSIIDYNLNKELVSAKDLKELKKLNIQLKFDIVLNHLSVNSPQFKDLLKNGENSKYKDFFINWNEFWKENGTLNDNGVVVPQEKYLEKLFMRKIGLPVLKVPFPDGTEKPYWNTFYQEVKHKKISVETLASLKEVAVTEKKEIVKKVNEIIENNQPISSFKLEKKEHLTKKIKQIVQQNSTFLGQMDVNANSELLWEFYEKTLAKLKEYGCKILRLDAFAYLHKEVGKSNFFNKPGTWQHLNKIEEIAQKNNLILLPEIHAEYGANLHDEVAENGYQIYDFFLPGLIIHALEKNTNQALYNWINEIINKGYKTVNMLGCHDGIPFLDLKGKTVNNKYYKGLLEDDEIEAVMETVIERGGRVKNLYDPSGKKISYYQVNATYFSALGEHEQKLLLARAIQLFVPGIAQIWYLDLFAGRNNYNAVKKGGTGAHKEINRTSLSNKDIEEGLKKPIVKNQLKLIRLRNTSNAFNGKIIVENSAKNELHIKWQNNDDYAILRANLTNFSFSVKFTENKIEKKITF